MMFPEKWETIGPDWQNTQRLKVPGGWLVRTFATNGPSDAELTAGVAMSFVADSGYHWTFEKPEEER